VPEAWVGRMIPIADLERKLRTVQFAPEVLAADQFGQLDVSTVPAT